MWRNRRAHVFCLGQYASDLRTCTISFVKNGSCYDVDRGVDPDVFLIKTSTICDREKLTGMINNLD